jgi:hypothetical protein
VTRTFGLCVANMDLAALTRAARKNLLVETLWSPHLISLTLPFPQDKDTQVTIVN